ncbi:hypothetical protein FRC06_004310, partial [Ceratobasidium sp. 370]
MASKFLTDVDVLSSDRHLTRCMACCESLSSKSVKRHCGTDRHVANLKEFNKRKQVKPITTPSPAGHDLSAAYLVDDSDHIAATQAWFSASANDGFDTTWDSLCSGEDDAITPVEDDSIDSSHSTLDPNDTDDLFMQLHGDTNVLANQPPNVDQQNDDGWETESQDDVDDVPPQSRSIKYNSFSSTPPSPWSPFPSKAMYLANLLSHSRRVHFGRTHMKGLLEYARETQGEKIPSYHALRAFQKTLKERMGDTSKRHVSSGGTVYYVNQISDSLKQ